MKLILETVGSRAAARIILQKPSSSGQHHSRGGPRLGGRVAFCRKPHRERI